MDINEQLQLKRAEERAVELEGRVEELEGELEDARAEIARQDGLLSDQQDKLDDLSAQFTPNDGIDEPLFREQVRDMLDLDWSVHDAKILSEIKRLKEMERKLTAPVRLFIDGRELAETIVSQLKDQLER